DPVLPADVAGSNLRTGGWLRGGAWHGLTEVPLARVGRRRGRHLPDDSGAAEPGRPESGDSLCARRGSAPGRGAPTPFVRETLPNAEETRAGAAPPCPADPTSDRSSRGQPAPGAC